MAQKKITDLTLRSNFDGTVNLPGDDTSQTYRVTGAQIATYIQSIIEAGVTAQTSNYAVVSTDRIVTMSASGGNRTVTLPTAVTWKGKLTVKKIDITSNTVQILTTSSQTIDQYSSGDIYLRQRNESITFYSDGSNWIILDHTNGYNSAQPAGSIQMYAGATAPVGWQLCDGSAISRTTYAELYRVISTTYGTGDGSSTFNVPDMRGVFARGAGSQTISGKAYTGTRGTTEGDAFQGHYHTLTDPGHNHTQNSHNHTQDAHTHSYTSDSASYGLGGATAKGNIGSGSTTGSTTATNQAATATNQSNTTGATVVAALTDGSNGTPRTGSETKPANISLSYIIKL